MATTNRTGDTPDLHPADLLRSRPRRVITGFVIEAFLTLGLVSTVLATASRAQNIAAMSAIGVGA